MISSIMYSLMLLLLLISGSVTAQNYIVLKSERIHTPWDTDSTLHPYNIHYPAKFSLTLDKKIVMMQSAPQLQGVTFYLYDETSDTWKIKQIDSNYWNIHPLYTLGFKRIGGSVYKESNLNEYLGQKWIFNYGDSSYLDTGIVLKGNRYYLFTSPSNGFYLSITYAQERIVVNQGGSPVKPYNSYLYKRIYRDGISTSVNLIDLEGGNPGLPEHLQDYQNDINFSAIDDETVVASVKRYYYYPPMNGYGAKYNTDKYNLLTTNSGITWTRSPYNKLLPKKNADGQWFIRQDPATTYLYYSERHEITPKQPIYFGFIDPLLKNVTITSEYANGTKGYYGLCNSKTDSSEKDKFLIYSITNLGKLQKYIILDTFEYRNVASYDSSIYDKQILYADDTLMYVQLTTQKFVARGLGTLDTIYYSQPQVYKIHLPNQTNGVEEQPLSTTLQLYPNPTDQILRWNIHNGRATITDALGVEVVSVPASSMQADISGLAIGVYYLTIRSGGESVTKVFTVMR